MIEVQHDRSSRTVTVIATCDECGLVSMSVKRLARDDVNEAKIVIRARGWTLVGSKAVCPKKHDTKKPSIRESKAS